MSRDGAGQPGVLVERWRAAGDRRRRRGGVELTGLRAKRHRLGDGWHGEDRREDGVGRGQVPAVHRRVRERHGGHRAQGRPEPVANRRRGVQRRCDEGAPRTRARVRGQWRGRGVEDVARRDGKQRRTRHAGPEERVCRSQPGDGQDRGPVCRRRLARHRKLPGGVALVRPQLNRFRPSADHSFYPQTWKYWGDRPRYRFFQ